MMISGAFAVRVAAQAGVQQMFRPFPTTLL